jgi:hypothetical protein
MAAYLSIAAFSLSIPIRAQSAAIDVPPPASFITPLSVLRWTANLPEKAGHTIEIRFALYPDQAGGLALWSETQQVKVDAAGRYSVLLGATTPEGLAPGLFQDGQPRWIEARPLAGAGDETGGATAQTRTLLAAVPYAFKSVDSETLAGRAASDYVTREDLQSAVAAGPQTTAGVNPETSPTVTGTGTTDYVPLWTGATTLGNSVIAEKGSSIGIGTPTPATTLDVNGGSTLRGGMSLPAAAATANAGVNSPAFEQEASAYSSTTKAAVAQKFLWQVATVGNNTATPSANLNLLFGTTTKAPAPTGLSIAPTGLITFASGQTFPGTGAGGGTITGVTAGTGLTGGGTTGKVTLAVDRNVVPELATYNTFTGFNLFNIGLSSIANAGTAAVSAFGTNGVPGVYGSSDTGEGGYFVNTTTATPAVYAIDNATGNPGLAIAVKGYVPNAASIAVLGKAAGAGSTGVDGEDVGGADSTGVYAYTTGAGSNALYAKATGPADANNYVGSGVVGVSASGNGVVGSSLGESSIGATLATQGYWGVSGDTGGKSGLVFSAGVLGTAGDSYAGFFESNGADLPTVNMINDGNNGAALMQANSSNSFTLDVSNNGGYGGAKITNTSNTEPTLYLSNNGTGGVTDFLKTKEAPAARDGIFKTMLASTATGVCGIGGNGDLSCTGQMKSLVSAGDSGRQVETYAMQSPENWMEDFGSGDLARGVAVVKIDPAFAATVSESADYHVFITPNGDSKGLYVIRKTATSFEVRESGGGTSSLSFDYRIVGKRRGYEAQRLTDVTESLNAAKAMAQSEASRKRPSRPVNTRPQTGAQNASIANAAAMAAAAPEPAPRRVIAPAAPAKSNVAAGLRP